jgi:hypothetical protein
MAVDINTLLANLALADSHHDFAKLHCAPHDVKNGLQIFDKGMPKGHTIDHLDENSVLNNSVIESNLRSALDGGAASVTTHTGHTYACKPVALDGKSGKQIVEESGIDGMALVVDFNQHGVLGRLKTGEQGGTLYYAYLSETENDPAGKTPVDAAIWRHPTGANIIPVTQAGSEPVIYGNGTYDEDKPSQDFFSAYNITLSPIIDLTYFGAGKKTSVNVNITNPSGTMTHQVPDAKKANSIQSLVNEFLKSIFVTLQKESSSKAEFDANVGWLKKRSGDWLQALACLDINNRMYKVPPGFPDLPEGKLPKSTRGLFVTHDRIALSFALLMGVECMFIKADSHTIIMFTIPAREGRAPDEICTEQLEANKGDMRAVSEFLPNYMTMRKSMLDGWATKIRMRNRKGAEDLKIYTKELMELGLHYAHTFFEVSDVTPVITNLSQDADKCLKLRAFLTGRALWQMHTKSALIPKTFDRQIERKDEWEAIQEWAKPPPQRVTRRLFQTDISKNTKDEYSFIGYISKLPDGDPVKSGLAAKLETLRAEPDEKLRLLFQHSLIFVSMKKIEPAEFARSVTANPAINIPAVIAANEEIQQNPNESSDDIEVGDESEIPVSRRSQSGPPPDETPPPPVQLPSLARLQPPQTEPPRAKMFWETLTKPAGKRRTRRKKGGWEENTKFTSHLLEFPTKQTTHPLLAAHVYFMGYEAPEPLMDQEGVRSGGAHQSIHLLPIYVILDAMGANMGPDLEESPDIGLYSRYYKFLELLVTKMEGNTPNDKKILGRAIRAALITSRTPELIFGEDDLAFNAMSSTFSSYVCGSIVDENIDVFKAPVAIEVLQSAYTESKSQVPMTVDDLSRVVTALRIRISKELMQADTTPVPPAPVSNPVAMRTGQSVLSTLKPAPSGIKAGRRRTRRLTNDFLQSVRHQSIKMSSRRHSLSGKPFKR